jgi:site-specific recombinase XerD
VLRRTFACTNVILHAMGLAGLDLVSLQQAMGHERLDTTQIYLADVADYLQRFRRPIGIADGATAILEAAGRAQAA